MTAVFDSLYSDIESYIISLENSFLKRHLANPLATPEDYDYDVKSYCILCHAAFEDYAETIALKVLEVTIDNYNSTHKISESLMALMHFKANGQQYLDKFEDGTPLETIFDYNRKVLKDIKSRFSKEINVQNHGVSLKYIRQLLMPVAIDIPNDVLLLESLKQLASERGFYAHKFKEKGVLKRSIDPEKAKTIVEDCLLIC